MATATDHHQRRAIYIPRLCCIHQYRTRHPTSTPIQNLQTKRNTSSGLHRTILGSAIFRATGRTPGVYAAPIQSPPQYRYHLV
eukprot:357627-Chlamydomonas_euryale.AAC.2